jgi:hypothetical protein
MRPVSEIHKGGKPMRITMRSVALATRQYGNLQAGELMGRGRRTEIALLRQVAHWLCVRRVGRSTLDVGLFFDRDHSTVIHSVRSIDNRLIDDQDSGEAAYMIERIWSLAIDPPVDPKLAAENDNQLKSEPLPYVPQIIVRAPVEDHSKFYVML